MLRRGPRPLLLHLTLAMLKSHGLPDGSSSSNANYAPPSNPNPSNAPRSSATDSAISAPGRRERHTGFRRQPQFAQSD